MRRLASLLVVALLGLSGCGSDGVTRASGGGATRPTSSASTDATTIRRYVALGDSYTAAPYVYLTDVANGCLRSSGNYPALLAEKLGVAKHVDVSCSGATSKDLPVARTRSSGRPCRPSSPRSRATPTWSPSASGATTSGCSARWSAPARSAVPRAASSRRAKPSGAGRSTCAGVRRRTPHRVPGHARPSRDPPEGARRDGGAGRLPPDRSPGALLPEGAAGRAAGHDRAGRGHALPAASR